MGCDAEGIVSGNFEGRVFEVVQKIIDGINASCVCQSPVFKERQMPSGHHTRIMVVSTRGTIAADFKDGKDNRHMFVGFKNHGDYKELCKGPKLIIRLGAWGNCDKIIKACLDQFDERCWYVPNDCGEYDKKSAFYHGRRRAKVNTL